MDARPRYADPTLCPDCRAVLPTAPFRCPACALPLQGFLATQLLTTLREADSLLDRLRASTVAAPARTPDPRAASAPTAPVPMLDPELPPMPRPPAADPRRGLQGASVPKILLGLGATCLLVAAVIFLAVAWTWLGIGGRTAVLVGLTGATGTAGVLLGRRGLTVAAEALTTVTFGLVVLDVVGADNAGWLGVIEIHELVRVVGIALLVPALALALPTGRLVVPQLVAPTGLALFLGTVDWSAYAVGAMDVGGIVSVIVLAALVAVARRVGASVLAWVSGLLAAAVWAASAMWAFVEAAENPTVSGLWADGHGYELVAVSLLSLLTWGVAWSEPLVRQGAPTLVASTLTLVTVLPWLDDGPTTVTLVAIAVTVVWAVVAAATPPSWYAVPRVPLACGALAVATTGLSLAGLALASMVSVGAPLTESAAVRLSPEDLPLHPLFLMGTTATVAFAALLALPRQRLTVPACAGATAVAGLLTLGLYPVPLALVLAVPVVAAVVLLAVALQGAEDHRSALAATAAVLGGLATVMALPSLVLTTVAVAMLAVGLGVTLAVGRFPGARESAGLGLPVAVGALIWLVAELADVDPALRAVPTLVVLGLLALFLPRLEIEAAAALTGFVAAVVAIPAATDVSVSLALHLTLVGGLVTTSSIVHPSRRAYAWAGGVLLAMATWVRLLDLGYVSPEPYTLPSALALVLVGLYRIRSSDDAATGPTLGPGLVLATVPSLLWVLVDPVTVRAAVLGLACLALVLAGVALRWHAPVVVGSLVGGIVVVRELAPYALETPQWMLIGAAGTVLIACGITWESRMRDLQQAAAYLGRLR